MIKKQQLAILNYIDHFQKVIKNDESLFFGGKFSILFAILFCFVYFMCSNTADYVILSTFHKDLKLV